MSASVSRCSAGSQGTVLLRAMDGLLKCLRALRRGLDVSVLRGLVASGKQDDDDSAAPEEVDAVARPVVDAQFGNTVADGPDIIRVAEREATNPDVDAGLGDPVSQACEPLRVLDGLPDTASTPATNWWR